MVNFDKLEFCNDAENFMDSLDEKTRNKVYYNIRKAQMVNDDTLFKKLDGEIWEFRTLYNKKHIRLFAFRYREGDIETVVVATHGMVKKTSKVPRKEIKKANEIRIAYQESKEF
jgi:phage-related protein